MSGENIDEYKNNEDYPGMEESLVPNFNQFTTSKEGDVKIDVCNPQTREEKFKKYYVYTIQGSDKNGDINVIRRYSDFDKIRTLLVLRWPGCYIPPLPPKSLTSNKESRFIEERMKHLQFFCLKIASLPHLHYSEEYQLFIRSTNPDLEKAFLPLQKLDYEEMIKRYQTNFGDDLSNKQLTNEMLMKIQQFKLFLQKTQGHFEGFKKVAKNVAQARRNYYKNFVEFHNQVCVEYEKNIFSEYHNNTTEKNVFNGTSSSTLGGEVEKITSASTQPSLEYLYEWIKVESREIEAFMEAINQREKFENLKTKNQEKQRADMAELQKVLSGKTTLKGLFSRKSKEEESTVLENAIAATGKEMENLIVLHDLVSLLIFHREIVKYKANKMTQYYQVIKLTAQNELGNVSSMVEYWRTIAKSDLLQGQQIDA